MGAIVVTSDFIGKYAVPQDSYSILDSVIDSYEESYLIDLLGVDLSVLFKADLTNKIPVTTKYLTLFNPFNNDYGCNVKRSIGIKNMLLGFIVFEYMRQLKFKNTQAGVTVENSELNKETDATTLFKLYNESINTMHVIQWKVGQTLVDYVGYNGQCKKISNPFF